MKKIILILVGLAMCFSVEAHEKAKTTNVQGMLWQLTMRSILSKKVRKQSPIKIPEGDSICSSSSPKKQVILLWG